MEEQITIINNKHCEKCNKTFTSNAHYLLHCETELHKTGKRKTRTDIKEEFKCDICNLYTTKQQTTTCENTSRSQTAHESEALRSSATTP